MAKFQEFLKKYKKEVIATLVFILCLGIFSVSYAFAAVEPVKSIVIQSEYTDFASSEEGSWQVTKSGYWTGYGEAEVTLDVNTTLMTDNQYTDIIFVLDISGSMSGEKLERVKSDSKELISSLLSNQNNRAALITFDTESRIVSELTNDEELLTNEIDNLQDKGSTNYYQALVNVDSILQNYQKESGREMIVLFLTDGYPNVDTPNQITQYQYLKSAYPYITINGIQYEMGNSILNPIKEISDNQFIADMDTLNNVLFDASVAPVTYDTYQIVDYIDNENFSLESKDDIKVSQGSVELTEENGKQKIIWTIDNLASGREANLTMKLKLKDEYLGQGGIYPTNESTEVISKIEDQEEDVTTTNTPILADNYKVIYDGNAPEGCSVTNIPDAYNYSVFSTIEISDEVPNCSGYQFMGWEITTNGVTRVSEDYFIMPESDVVIKAEWSKIGITKSMNGTVNNMGDPIMKSYSYNPKTDYHSSTYKSKITFIVTKDNMEIPSTAIETWDVSKAGDGSVIAYIEDDGRGTGTYKVTIGAQGNIIASSCEYLFSGVSSNSFSSLETIDLTYLDTSQVDNMDAMFSFGGAGFDSSSTKLTTIIFGEYWDTSQVTDMRSMFYGCDALTNIDLSRFDTSKVKNMSSMFGGCNKLTNLALNTFNTSQVTDMSDMFSDCSSLTSLDVSSFNTSRVTNMGDMFSYCRSLASFDVSNFDTSQVTDMSSMFESCRSLTSLDVSNFDTSQVTDMSSMFYNCGSIPSLNVSNFDTSQVTQMRYMFFGCDGLTSLDLSSFDTAKVTDMESMFRESSSLQSLNISHFNTSQVKNMGLMFTGCSSLNALDLSNFNTSQVTNMYYMFSGCNSLTSLNIINFDTSQVTNMSYMFSSCSKLTSLDVSNFNTSQVTNMSRMFSYCRSLASLDVSNFNTSQVTDMSGMFEYCSSLTNLDMQNATFTATSYSNMFSSVANGINIIVKDATAKTWIEARLSDVGRTGTVTIASI